MIMETNIINTMLLKNRNEKHGNHKHTGAIHANTFNSVQVDLSF